MRIYEVQEGDSLGKIAEKFGVSTDELYEYNSPILEDKSSIRPGQVLRNPNEIADLIDQAIFEGKTFKDISQVLKISPEEVQEIYDLGFGESGGEAPVLSKELDDLFNEAAFQAEPELTDLDFGGDPMQMVRDVATNSIRPSTSPELLPIEATGIRKELNEFADQTVDQYSNPDPMQMVRDVATNSIKPEPTKRKSFLGFEEGILGLSDLPEEESESKYSESLDALFNEVANTDAGMDLDQSRFQQIVNKKSFVEEDEARVKSEFSDELNSAFDLELSSIQQLQRGAQRAVARGLTLNFADDLEAMLDSSRSGRPYSREKFEIDEEVAQFSDEYPAGSFVAEMVGAIPTGYGLARGMAAKGINSIGAQGGAEAFIYGAGEGNSFDERAKNALVYGAGGAGLGIMADKAINLFKPKPPSKELTVQGDGSGQARSGDGPDTPEMEPVFNADGSPKVDPDGSPVMAPVSRADMDSATEETAVTIIDPFKVGNKIEYEYEPGKFTEATVLVEPRDGVVVLERNGTRFRLTEDQLKNNRFKWNEKISKWDNAAGQNQDAQDWRSATNAGEFVEGLKNSIINFYDQNLVGMSTRIGRRASEYAGGRAQRSDEAALKISAREVEDFVDPIEDVAKLWNRDKTFAGMLLNYAAGRTSRQRIIKYVEENSGYQDAEALTKYLKWSDRKNLQHQTQVSGKTFSYKDGAGHLATRLTKKARDAIKKRQIEERARRDGISEKEAAKRIKAETKGKLPKDQSDYSLKRGDAEAEGFNLSDYENPFLSNTRRIIGNERVVQYAQKFGVKAGKPGVTPDDIMDGVEQAMLARGINPKAAKMARDAIVENMIGQSESPNGWIQALQSIGYAGTLAGPKSAILNIHDIPQTIVTQGRKSARGLSDINKINLNNFGLTGSKSAQNFGEFQNRLNDIFASGDDWASKTASFTRGMTDKLMRYSGFQALDAYGKRGVSALILRRNLDDVQSGKGLKDQWGFYFNDTELGMIEAAMKRHGMDFDKYKGKSGRLVEELVMAGLGQQQLISGAGRPAGWARNPNMRPFWALRGFAIKQQAIAYKNIVENLQKGNVDDAVEYAKQFAIWSAGSYAVINEARQVVFGDRDVSIEGFLRSMGDQAAGVITLNTLGFNEYQMGKYYREGLVSTALDGLMPIAFDVPLELVSKGIEAGAGERPVTDILPLTKQTVQAVENIEGMFTGN